MDTLSVGLLLFPGFEVLDAAGPIEVLNVVSRYLQKNLKLSIISETLELVSAGTITQDQSTPFIGPQNYAPTHDVNNAPQLDLLIVPGGAGVRADCQPYIDYISRVYHGHGQDAPVKALFSVCTGSVLFAQAGVLDGKRATTNKKSWAWATSRGPKTLWIAHARWVVDGNIWTTSGVSAGIDGMLAFVEAKYGEQTAEAVCHIMEYTRIKDANNDPWAEVNECHDVVPQA